MAKFVHARNNFQFGEVSSKYYGRNDIEQYRGMCEEVKNFIVRPQGGVTKRPGTFAIIKADTDLDGCTEVKLIPFYVNKLVAFMVIIAREGSTQYLKYYDVTTGNFTSSGGTASASTVAQYSASGGTFGTDVVYTSGSFHQIEYTQYNDFLVITDRNTPPMVIVRDSGALKYFVWSFGEITVTAGSTTFALDQQHRNMAFSPENATATTITPSATTGSITLTASAAAFSSNMVGTTGKRGTMFRIRNGATTGVALVTGYTSTTVVDATVLVTMPGTAAYTGWSESVWSRRKGFPSCCAFNQGRLVFAGSDVDYDKVWFSQLGDLYEFSRPDLTTTLVSTDSYEIVPLAEAASISWLAPGSDLIMGTEKSTKLIAEIDETVALGRDNTQITEAFNAGFRRTQPARIQGSVLGIDLSGQKIKEVVYDYRERGYVPQDIGHYADHMVSDHSSYDPGLGSSSIFIHEIAHQEEPYNVTWARTATGTLLGVTRNKEFGVQAWHYHTIGGSASVLAIATIPGAIGDQLIMATRRTINGTAVTRIEGFEMESISDELYDSTYANEIGSYHNYLDFAGYSKTAASLTHTFSHLPSTEVSVVADGIYVGEFTTDGSGVVTLTTAASVVLAGFKTESKIIPLSLESNSLFGNGLGQVKRVDEVTILFDRTVGAKFGVEDHDDDLQEIQFRTNADVDGDPIPLFTGEKTFKMTASYRRQQKVVVVQDKPYPCSINSIICKGVLYD